MIRTRPVPDVAGVAGGGLESDRDPVATGERVVRDVADDRDRRQGRRAKDIELNEEDVAPPDDPTRIVTSEPSDE
jgi:hypothetical protein